MTKKIVMIGLILAVVTYFKLTGAKGVEAASTNAAVVINDSGCFMFDGTGKIVYTVDGQVVSTAGGVNRVTCRANDVASVTTAVIRLNYDNTGAYCFTTYGYTQNWQEIITPSGRAILSCHSNP